MATLADSGRITNEVAAQEITRLTALWRGDTDQQDSLLSQLLTEEQIAGIDLFDRLQLEAVIAICRRSSSLSEAGRQLFAVSRAARDSQNDSDRLRKFLARFGLVWRTIKNQGDD
ncbi:MAG: transcriptional regulator [Betaproteobacteria bacterium]|nr:transcriptional regulator [Betaproteobacteria bacterium]